MKRQVPWQADKANDMLEPSNATEQYEQGRASDGTGKSVISSLVAESLPTQEAEAVEAEETQASVTDGVTETKKVADDMEVEAAEAGSLG